MLRHCLAALALLMPSATVNAAEPAQKIWLFNGTAIDNSIKCDLASAARSGRYKILPNLMKARVTVNVEKSNNVESKLVLKFPWLEIGGSSGNATGNTMKNDYEATFNISGENSVNCRKNNQFTTGNLECLKDALRRLAEFDDVKATCERIFTATYTGSASAKLPAWKIEIGPDLSAKNSVSYKVNLIIPASKAKAAQ